MYRRELLVWLVTADDSSQCFYKVICFKLIDQVPGQHCLLMSCIKRKKKCFRLTLKITNLRSVEVTPALRLFPPESLMHSSYGEVPIGAFYLTDGRRWGKTHLIVYLPSVSCRDPPRRRKVGWQRRRQPFPISIAVCRGSIDRKGVEGKQVKSCGAVAERSGCGFGRQTRRKKSRSWRSHPRNRKSRVLRGDNDDIRNY